MTKVQHMVWICDEALSVGYQCTCGRTATVYFEPGKEPYHKGCSGEFWYNCKPEIPADLATDHRVIEALNNPPPKPKGEHYNISGHEEVDQWAKYVDWSRKKSHEYQPDWETTEIELLSGFGPEDLVGDPLPQGKIIVKDQNPGLSQ